MDPIGNFIANLSAEERKEVSVANLLGSKRKTPRIRAMVAPVDNLVGGFLCAFRKEFDTGSPVIATMLASYDRLTFHGKPLSSFSSYIYGPVCIGRNYRRRGLLRGLYEAQKKDLAGQFEIGVAFVSRNNPHSLSAHVAGLGMIEAGDFDFKGNIYATLAFRLPAKMIS